MMGPSSYTPVELSHKQRTQLVGYHNADEKPDNNQKKIISEPITKCSNCIIT